MISRSLRGVAYHALIHIARWALTSARAENLWHRALAAVAAPDWSTVHIHGRRVRINSGNPYPAFLRRYPHYNDPLPHAVRTVAGTLGRPISVVDVGAAIGDSVLLIESRCPGLVTQYRCIEGDPDFTRLLNTNLGHFTNVEIINAVVTSVPQSIPALVKHHAGTASAQGFDTVAATTLDHVLDGASKVDLIKVDVDGFDGRALAGARRTILRTQPVILFEWHPILIQRTGGDARDVFDFLDECGYRAFVWFTKYGDFSHFSSKDVVSIERLSEFCAGARRHPDWHYDILTAPEGGPVDLLALADVEHPARKWNA